MKNLSLLFLTHLTLFFICVYAQNIAQTQFVYRWPETYCSKETPVAGCNQIPPLKFTLNGFWGTDSNGNIPPPCPDTDQHDWNRVFTTAVINDLNSFWPSLTAQTSIDMWKEAWYTYGACLKQKLKGPTQYFNRAIRLSKAIGELLKDHLISTNGIVPCDSATYNNDEILNSLKEVANNKDVSFSCAGINATHAYLNQVIFCYTDDPKNFVDCPISITRNRCSVQNIIVPRPSPPPPIPPPPPRPRPPKSLQTTREKLQPNSLWRSLVDYFNLIN